MPSPSGKTITQTYRSERHLVLGQSYKIHALRLLKERQDLTDIGRAAGVQRERASSIAVSSMFQYTLQRGDTGERQ